MIMKYIVKKILKETYDQQIMNDLCQKISTGSNQVSEDFMKNLENYILSSELPTYLKNSASKIFTAYKSDLYNGVKKDSFGGMTGDSESDESDTYLTQLQTLICDNYMNAMD